MSKNLQSLSEKQGIEKGVFEAVKNLEGPARDPFLRNSHFPKTPFFGAKSFYGVGKDKITKKNFFGKCSFEKDGTDIPFHCHVSDSIYTETCKSIDDYYRLILEGKSKIQSELDASGLTGRGGAGFPFSKKLEFFTREKSEIKYVVCNAEEGDTGAFSDKYLLESQTHLVLSGIYAAGICSGAREGILYVSDEYGKAIEILNSEIKKFKQTPAFKKEPFRFSVVKGDNAYITGEETALLNSLEGLRAESRVRPPFPVQEGLFGKPTLLSNVETFASLFWILKNGGRKHSELGTEKSRGVKLVSMGTHFNIPGVHEVEFGESLEKVIHEYGGGLKEKAKGFQIGGPLGGVVPEKMLPELNWSIESFKDAGFLLGHGSIVAITEKIPMIDFMKELFEFTANESCGKCFPCRLGSKAGENMVKNSREETKMDRQVLDDLLETLEIGSLCGLGGGVPLPVKNILNHFSSELEPYFKGASS